MLPHSEWFLDSGNGAPHFAAEPEFSLTLNTYAAGAALAAPLTDGNYTVGRWGAANALLGAPSAFTVGVDTSDAVFAAKLTVSESIPVPDSPSLVLNELSTAGAEITNTDGSAVDLTGVSLLEISSVGMVSHPLSSSSLDSGGFLAETLDFADGTRVVLLAADGVTILDSAVVKKNPRARFPDGHGAWLRPLTTTAGAANDIVLEDAIVISEIMYDHPPESLQPTDGASPGQWIELHNKSAAAVDLSGWKMVEGVRYEFAPGTMLAGGGYLVLAENPAAVQAVHAPAIAEVFGPWGGSLSHREDRLLLQDALGNPADEVNYFSEGRWPVAANAGGSSLELRDVRGDNDAAESWAASDESDVAPWQILTWRAANQPSLGGEPSLWHELNLLLVDGPGECLIDDVRVTDTTTGDNLLANGDFGAGAAGWRFLGNHRTSQVQAEPGNVGNSVLRLIASGAGEYQGNQIEATYVGNQALVAGREYEVSLRARWLTGGGRLNVRQYFGRLARTHVLAVAAAGGTPGEANSRATANAGPTIRNFTHIPATPAASQPVTVRVEAADPDGVAALDLKFSVDGGAWQTVAMTSADGRAFAGIIPGQAGGAVQFYVEAHDIPGAVSAFPARGPLSRAMYAVQDGRGAGDLQRVRLVMTPADAAFMHTPVNTLSNELHGATVIVDDRDIYYDVGVRLKGSFVGRNVTRVGFNLLFNSDRLFRGVHGKVAVDRSQHAAVGAVGEIIAKHMAAAAGGIPSMYDDMARFVHPSPTYSSMSHLRMAGFEKEYLETQFPNGGDGTMFEMEGFRWNLNTVDGNPASPKLPGNESGGTGYLNSDLGNYGSDKETYRWFMLQTMGRSRDDYSAIIPFNQMFSLSDAAFEAEARQRLDYEQFLRTLAFQSLVGPGDSIYTGGAAHNCRFYFRPHDGRAVYMPWDWDSVWLRPTNAGLIGTGNLAKVVTASPDTIRRYYCHLNDLIQTTFNTNYMSRWTQHYGAVSEQNFSGVLNYIGARAAFALSQLPTTTAFTAMAGTPDANGAVTLSGNANISVASIEVNGLAYVPTWTSTTAWWVTVPLSSGPNTITIRGLAKDGTPVAAASSVLEVNNPNLPGWPSVRINEWLAENDGSLLDPADGKSEDWLELYNPTSNPVNLSGWSLSDDPALPHLSVLPEGTSIPAYGFLLVWADNEPVQGTPNSPHLDFKLSKDGETLGLYAPDFHLIDSVSFQRQRADISQGRYADGATDIAPLTLPTPGSPNVLLSVISAEVSEGIMNVEFTTTPGIRYRVDFSTDLQTWFPVDEATVATGASLLVTDPASVPLRFYRAVILP